MRLAPRLRSFLRAVVFRHRMERDMEEEWQFHLDARIDDLVSAGLTRPDASARARREFGDPERWKEYGRDARDEVGGRLRRDGTGRDHGYPGGRQRPPRFDPDPAAKP